MNKKVKKILKIFFIGTMLCVTAYGVYLLYDYILQDTIKKIQKGVSKGVCKGICKSIGKIINPFKWF